MRKRLKKRGMAFLLAMLLVCNVWSEHYVNVDAANTAQSVAETLPLSKTAEGNNRSLTATQSGFNITEVTVTVDGKPLSETNEVYAGADVEVEIQWDLDNTLTAPTPWENQVFVIDTNSDGFKNSGIDFSGMKVGTESDPQYLYRDGRTDGQYYMKDGKIYITITNENFFKEVTRGGGVKFKGKIARDGDKTQDGSKKKIEFGTQSAEVTYYESKDPSSLWLNKSASGNVYSETDASGKRKYYQTFTVTMGANNGKVKGIDLKDTPYANLKNPSACEITQANITSDSEGNQLSTGRYDSLQDLFDAIKGVTLYAGDTLTFQYTMEVAGDIFSKDAQTWLYQNKIEADYLSNRDPKNPKHAGPASATAWVSKPSIDKVGTGYKDGKVSWTITVNLGDYYEEGKNSLSDYLLSIVDILGTGLEKPGNAPDGRVQLDLSDFKQNPNNPREFTYTYETPVDESVSGSIVDTTVYNSVAMTTKENETYEKNSVPYGIGGAKLDVSKAFRAVSEARDAAGNPILNGDGSQKYYLTWDIVISNIPEGIGSLTLVDNTKQYWYAGGPVGEHDLLVAEILVDDKAVANSGGVTDYSVLKSALYKTDKKGLTIEFADKYVAARQGQSIKVTVRTETTQDTKDADGSLRNFINEVSGSYKDNNTGKSAPIPAVQAVYADTRHLLTKEGVEDEYNGSKWWCASLANSTGWDEVYYLVELPLSAMQLEVGKEFVITDILDSKMKLEEDTVKVQLEGNGNNVLLGENNYSFTKTRANAAGESAEKLSFTIPVTEVMTSYARNANTYLRIYYKAELKDKTAALTSGEPVTVKNNVTGTYGGSSIGSAVTENQIEGKAVVGKTAQNPDEKGMVKYTVTVNEEGLTLLQNGGRLEAVDTLGMALVFVDVTKDRFKDFTEADKKKYGAVTVSECVVTQNAWGQSESWQPLSADEYSYTFDKNERKLTFDLPDGKYLRIEYYAYIVAKPGTVLDASNSSNNFKLSGFTSDSMGSSHHFDDLTVENSGYTYSELGSIILYKFWEDKPSHQIALNGSVFKLVEVEYDKGTGTFTEGITLRDDIRITDENMYNSQTGKILIEGLPINTLMALYEVKSADGFSLRKRPYYFYIKGVNVTGANEFPTELVSEFQVDPANPNELEYQNYEAGTLVLKKTILGEVTKAEAEGALTFTVTCVDSEDDVDNGWTQTYRLKDFTYANGEWTLTLNDLVPGTYEVEETVKDIDGHTLASVKYNINSGGWTEAVGVGEKASAAVKAKETATVVYQNDYRDPKTSTKVVISKQAVGGGKELAGAELTISGERDDGEPFTELSHTVEEQPWTVELEPGTYTLTEKTAPKGFKKTESVTFKVDKDHKVYRVDAAGGEEEITDRKVVMQDAPLDVEIDKVALTSQKEIPGATLTLYYAQDVDATTGKPKAGKDPVTSWTSGTKPYPIGEYLELGKEYILIEEHAPEGFGYSENVKFSIDADGKVTGVSGGNIGNTTSGTAGNKVIMQDEIIRIYLNKVALEDNSKEIADARIAVYHTEDVVEATGRPKPGAKPVEEWRSREGEAHEFGSSLEAGKSYVFVETVPAAGYDLAASIYFTVNKNGTVQVDSKNVKTTKGLNDETIYLMEDGLKAQPNYNVKISKWDITNNRELAGAELEISGEEYGEKESDPAIPIKPLTWTSASEPRTVTLKPGQYTLTETTAPKGYTKAESINFEVTRDGRLLVEGEEVKADEDGSYPVRMEDAELDLEIDKTAWGTGEQIEGAVLELYRKADVTTEGVPKKDAKYVAYWRSAKDKVYKVPSEKLVAGETYVLIETTAPQSYAYSENIEFTLGEDGKVTLKTTGDNVEIQGNRILMKDKKISLKLNKVDLNGGAELEGAVICLYRGSEIDKKTGELRNPNTKALASWTSRAGETKDFGEWLVAGESYVFKEMQAPQGYDLTANIYFTVEKDGTIKVTGGTAGVQGTGDAKVYLMKDKLLADRELASLVLSKNVIGIDAVEIGNKGLAFQVQSIDVDPKYDKTFYVGEAGFEYDKNSGNYTCTISNLIPGTYKVTELLKDSTPEGMMCTDQSYRITLKNTRSVLEGMDEGGEGTEEFTLQASDQATVLYSNTYTSTSGDSGELIIQKRIQGPVTREEAEGSLIFTVKNRDTRDENTYTLKDFDSYRSLDGVMEWTKTLEATPGGYDVVESVKEPITGVTLITKYRVSGDGNVASGPKGGRKASEVTVTAGGSTFVQFENKYTEKSKPGGGSDDDDDESDDKPTLKSVVNKVTTSLTRTGDGAPLGLWLLLLLLGGAGVIAGGIAYRKRKGR